MFGRPCLTACLMFAWLCCGGSLASAEAAEPQTRLAIQETAFTINDKPVFLLGCSYYGALGASDETWQADLDQMQKLEINWIRVWVTWGAFGRDVSAVDGTTGKPREEYFKRLETLIAACDRRGMVVDVTLSRGNGVTGPARLKTLAAHEEAVRTLADRLKPRRNWYLDLSNERNIEDQRFTSYEDLKHLRKVVREVDPARLVTASHAGDLSEDDVRRYVLEVGVDFLSPHRPRHAQSAGQTEEVTRRLLARMKELERVVPVHYQEPFRRAYGYSPSVKDFAIDLRGALAGGAAGWCFHNGDTRSAQDGKPRRSFDLRSMRLFEQLDAVEREALEEFAEIVKKLEDRK